MTTRRSPILIFFLLFSFSLQAQYDFTGDCFLAYQDLINLKLHSADRLIQKAREENQGNLVPYALESFHGFLTLYIGEDRSHYKKLREDQDEIRNRLQSGNRKSPFYSFFLGEHYLQWALLKFKFGDFTSGAYDLRQAYIYLEEGQSQHPGFLPGKMAFGVIRVMIGIVPENYRWITDLLGVEGSIRQGLTDIRSLAFYEGDNRLYQLYQPEALFYMGLISSNLQQEKKDALQLIPLFENSEVLRNVKGSSLMTFAMVSISVKNHQNDEALRILKKYPPEPDAMPFYFLDFLHGQVLLNKLDFSAKDQFLEYINRFGGQHYRKSALQRLAWIALLQGDSAGYTRRMKEILLQPETFVDEDKQALREAKTGERPSVNLLKARLLFDGGYYREALGILVDNPVASAVGNHRDLLEYTYRMARIYHESGQTENAIKNYEITVERGRNAPYYFAANSALQLGLIFESQGKNETASKWYKACLSMHTEEYKTSLDQKAKAGLNRVRKK